MNYTSNHVINEKSTVWTAERAADIDMGKTHKWTTKEMKSCFHPVNSSNIQYRINNITGHRDHFLNLWDATSQFRDFDEKSDKLERHWINIIGQKALSTKNDYEFQLLFGPFVPLFIYWTRMQIPGVHSYQVLDNLTDCRASYITKHLNDNVTYITVVQYDQGIIPTMASPTKLCKETTEKFKTYLKYKILVLSAGGIGNVIIPLLGSYHHTFQDQVRNETTLEILKSLRTRPFPIEKRYQYLIGFAGTLWHIRPMLNDLLQNYTKQVDPNFYVAYHGLQFRTFESECCKYILTPRGRGRTSFAFYENIMMDNIPIYVYNDIRWSPYTHILDKFSLHIQFDQPTTNYTLFMQQLTHMVYSIDNKTYHKMKHLLKENKMKYFTHEVMWKDIALFMTDGPMSSKSATNLKCVPENYLTPFYQQYGY